MRALSFAKPVAYLIGCLLYAVPDWLTDEFGSVTVDQVLYHLSFGSSALLNSDPELFWRCMRRAVMLPVFVALLLWSFDVFVGYSRRHGTTAALLAVRRGFRHAGKLAAGALHRLTGLSHRLFHPSMPVIVVIVGALCFADTFSLLRYAREFFGPDYFSGSYIDPQRVSLKAHKPKNLVLIYVESLENTYSDPSLFGRDLLQPLTALKGRPGVVTFDDYQQMPGAHFTIAGIVATQCGIPLKSLGLFGGNDQGEHFARFLPRAHCLGDILAERGYSNVFLNGPSVEFAGVGKFLRNHGYAKVLGKEEWLGLGEREETMSGWGLHDDDLFRRARHELAMLMKAGKPFNLTVLTIDTHHPYGQLSTRCAQQGYKDFEGIVECTAGQVADFIAYIEKNGWQDDIAVMIQGDHLAMGNTSYDKLQRAPRRTVFNMLITGKPEWVKNTDQVTHFDMLPTLLQAMGFQVRGERAGLGYAAVGTPGVARPQDRLEQMQAQLMNYSEAYSHLWDEPDLHEAPPVQPVQAAKVDGSRVKIQKIRHGVADHRASRHPETLRIQDAGLPSAALR